MQWDPDLECGVELVDNEHKELFRMVEKLLTDVEEGKTPAASAEALDFLGEYVVTHFAHEEELMLECNYPNADEHKVLHEKFVEALGKLKQKFDDSDGAPSVVIEINHAAMSWLVNHIKVIDRRFTDYYNESK